MQYIRHASKNAHVRVVEKYRLKQTRPLQHALGASGYRGVSEWTLVAYVEPSMV